MSIQNKYKEKKKVSGQPLLNCHWPGGGIDLNLSGIVNLTSFGNLKPLSLGKALSSTCHSSIVSSPPL
ncbi:hypothetical protein ACOSP7_017478 [Xanthoceras sorbifolium]